MDKRGVLFILAAAVLWGTTGTAQALAPAGAQSLAIGTLRLVVSAAALGVAALTTSISTSQTAQTTPGKMHPGLLLLSAACMAAYQVLFFAGVARTGVAVGTIVGIGSSPVLAGLLATLFRGERLTPRWAAATLLAVAGCALLALTGGEVDVDLFGILLAVGAGAAYATFSLASKNLLQNRSAGQVMAAVFGLGAIFLAPLLFSQDLSWLAQPRGMGVVLWLGVFATALAYTLFGKGLARTPVTAAVTLSLAEPLTAGLLGVLLLGERLTPLAWVGIALIFSGLAVLAVPGNRMPGG